MIALTIKQPAMTAQNNLPNNNYRQALCWLLAALVALYMLCVTLPGCLAIKEPVEITENLIQLQRIEVKQRGATGIAFLYWYNITDKQTYLQVVPCGDTIKYKPGIYRAAYMRH